MNYTCIGKNDGWWTYTLCPGKNVYQYHGEKGKADFAEYILGKFDKENYKNEIEKQESFVEVSLSPSSDPYKIQYYQEFYSDGTLCDLSGKPRVARVYYKCQTNGEPSIISLSEFKTCEYHIVVGTPIICFHPAIININDIFSKKKRDSNINCYKKD